jgi:cytochrome c biogenesis factor
MHSLLTWMKSYKTVNMASQEYGINELIVFFGTRRRNSKLLNNVVTCKLVLALIAFLILVSRFVISELTLLNNFSNCISVICSKFFKSSG